jgi:signal transduction histidine kinase
VSDVVKHSDATRSRVSITMCNRSIEIKVEDHGKGFSLESVPMTQPARHGFGLIGIRERARILGGRVEIQPSAPTGTAIVVTIHD